MQYTKGSLFNKLIKDLYETKTIAPSYKIAHILYTLMLIGQNSKGIGRYRIKKEVGLGDGSMKTLINRLKAEEIIMLEKEKQKGHILSEKGTKIYQSLLNKMKYPHKFENTEEAYVVGKFAAYTVIKHHSIINSVHLGINQRDEAIKIGGTGATCLTYDGKNVIFPDKEAYTAKINNLNLNKMEKGDIVLIGGGNTPNTAILATFAAALSLIIL